MKLCRAGLHDLDLPGNKRAPDGCRPCHRKVDQAYHERRRATSAGIMAEHRNIVNRRTRVV